MSNPLIELQRLLAPQAVPETGTVLAIGANVQVSTRRGVLTLPSSVDLRVGDCVLIRDGSIQYKVKPQEELHTYYL